MLLLSCSWEVWEKTRKRCWAISISWFSHWINQVCFILLIFSKYGNCWESIYRKRIGLNSRLNAIDMIIKGYRRCKSSLLCEQSTFYCDSHLNTDYISEDLKHAMKLRLKYCNKLFAQYCQCRKSSPGPLGQTEILWPWSNLSVYAYVVTCIVNWNVTFY